MGTHKTSSQIFPHCRPASFLLSFYIVRLLAA
jgi:hypothetical protein